MFANTLPQSSHGALVAIGESGIVKDAYLAGGTALALQLGHRMSVDFDFFTPTSFDSIQVVQQLAKLSPGFTLEQTAPGTILGFVGTTKFSLFEYQYPLLEPLISYGSIFLASCVDIAAMKLAAIGDRGARRDFIDLHCMVAIKRLFSLDDVFAAYDKKFAVLHQNKLHLLKSLMYFEEAEVDSMPHMLEPVDWKAVSGFFEKETKRLSRILLENS